MTGVSEQQDKRQDVSSANTDANPHSILSSTATDTATLSLTHSRSDSNVQLSQLALSISNACNTHWYGPNAYDRARQMSLADRGLNEDVAVASSDDQQTPSNENAKGDSNHKSQSSSNIAPSVRTPPSGSAASSFIESLSLQYGEMEIESWIRLLYEIVPINEVRSFVDLGCGRGQLLFLTALLCPWIRELHGYEIVASLTQWGQQVKAKVAKEQSHPIDLQPFSSMLRSTLAVSAGSQDGDVAKQMVVWDDADLSPSAIASRAHIHQADFIQVANDSDKPNASSMKTTVHAHPDVSMSTNASAPSSSSMPSWLTLDRPLVYVCATAFSSTLLSRLHRLLVRLPVGSVIALVSHDLPKEYNYSRAFQRIWPPQSTTASTHAHAQDSVNGAEEKNHGSPSASSSSSSPLKLRMSWGACNVHVYRKVHARSVENNILRHFKR